MFTTFKKGDPVPGWILRAPEPKLQQQATFGTDVRVDHGKGNTGPILVTPVKEFQKGEYLCIITGKGGYTSCWTGAPTYWKSWEAHEINEKL